MNRVQVPESLGKVTDRFIPSRPGPYPYPSLVIHIQDAHADPGAQKSVKAILDFLAHQNGFKQLLLEGAVGELEPGRFHFYRSQKRNREVWRRLFSQTVLSGAEMHILESGMKAQGFGAEREALYGKNLNLFRKISRSRAISERWIGNSYSTWETVASRRMPKEISRFLKQEWLFAEGRIGLLDYVRSLYEFGRGHRDFEEAPWRNQAEWPNLSRLAAILEMEKTLDMEKVAKEKEAFLRRLAGEGVSRELLRAVARVGETSSLHPLGAETRHLFESLWEALSERPFSWAPYAHFIARVRYEILSGEIDGVDLFREAERWADEILREKARRIEERKMLALFRNLSRLRKMLRLELTHEEWSTIRRDPVKIAPRDWTDRMRRIEGGKFAKVPLDEKLLGRAGRLFELSEEFYKTAVKRDRVLVETSLGRIQEKKIRKAVLITGGFHGEGLKDLLREKGIAYMQITPHFQKSSLPASRNGQNELDPYLDRMLHRNMPFEVPPVRRSERIPGAKTPERPQAGRRTVAVAVALQQEEILARLGELEYIRKHVAAALGDEPAPPAAAIPAAPELTIVEVTPVSLTSKGGVESYLDDLHRGLLANHSLRIHAVYPVATPSNTFEEKIGQGTLVHHQIQSAPWQWRQFFRVLARFHEEIGTIAKKEKVDVLHLHFPYQPAVHLAFWTAALRFRIPQVITDHLPATWNPQSPVSLGTVTAFLLSLGRAQVLGVSEHSARWLSLRHEVIGAGIDTDFFDPTQGDAEGFRQRWGLSPLPIIFYPARISRLKGQKDLLKMMEHLSKGGVDAQLVLMGTVFEADYGEQLHRQLNRLAPAIAKRIRILPEGSREDVRDGYAAADVVVFPTYYEALGLLSLEAMAMEKPVVGYRTGGLVDMIQQGASGTGFLVRPGHIFEMARRVSELLGNAPLREAMGRSGRAFVKSHYALDVFAKRQLDIYRRAAGKTPPLRAQSLEDLPVSFRERQASLRAKEAELASEIARLREKRDFGMSLVVAIARHTNLRYLRTYEFYEHAARDLSSAEDALAVLRASEWPSYPESAEHLYQVSKAQTAHFERHRNNILLASNQVKEPGLLLVAGAGHLLDIPLKALLEAKIGDRDKFPRVILSDVDATTVEESLRREPLSEEERSRVQIVEADLSGIIQDVIGGVQKFLAQSEAAGEEPTMSEIDVFLDTLDTSLSARLSRVKLPFASDSFAMYTSSMNLLNYTWLTRQYLLQVLSVLPAWDYHDETEGFVHIAEKTPRLLGALPESYTIEFLRLLAPGGVAYVSSDVARIYSDGTMGFFFTMKSLDDYLDRPDLSLLGTQEWHKPFNALGEDTDVIRSFTVMKQASGTPSEPPSASGTEGQAIGASLGMEYRGNPTMIQAALREGLLEAHFKKIREGAVARMAEIIHTTLDAMPAGDLNIEARVKRAIRGAFEAPHTELFRVARFNSLQWSLFLRDLYRVLISRNILHERRLGSLSARYGTAPTVPYKEIEEGPSVLAAAGILYSFASAARDLPRRLTLPEIIKQSAGLKVKTVFGKMRGVLTFDILKGKQHYIFYGEPNWQPEEWLVWDQAEETIVSKHPGIKLSQDEKEIVVIRNPKTGEGFAIDETGHARHVIAKPARARSLGSPESYFVEKVLKVDPSRLALPASGYTTHRFLIQDPSGRVVLENIFRDKQRVDRETGFEIMSDSRRPFALALPKARVFVPLIPTEEGVLAATHRYAVWLAKQGYKQAEIQYDYHGRPYGLGMKRKTLEFRAHDKRVIPASALRVPNKTVTPSPLPSPPERGRGEPPALRADRPGGGEGVIYSTEITVFPGVYHPWHDPSSQAMIEAMAREIEPSMEVYIVGFGSGIDYRLAEERGANVRGGVETNEAAYWNGRYTWEQFSGAERDGQMIHNTNLLELFPGLMKGRDRLKRIFFNAPSGDSEPEVQFDVAFKDPGRNILRTFIEQGLDYLAPDGKLVFGNNRPTAVWAVFRSLEKRLGIHMEQRNGSNGYPVFHITQVAEQGASLGDKSTLPDRFVKIDGKSYLTMPADVAQKWAKAAGDLDPQQVPQMAEGLAHRVVREGLRLSFPGEIGPDGKVIAGTEVRPDVEFAVYFEPRQGVLKAIFPTLGKLASVISFPLIAQPSQKLYPGVPLYSNPTLKRPLVLTSAPPIAAAWKEAVTTEDVRKYARALFREILAVYFFKSIFPELPEEHFYYLAPDRTGTPHEAHRVYAYPSFGGGRLVDVGVNPPDKSLADLVILNRDGRASVFVEIGQHRMNVLNKWIDTVQLLGRSGKFKIAPELTFYVTRLVVRPNKVSKKLRLMARHLFQTLGEEFGVRKIHILERRNNKAVTFVRQPGHFTSSGLPEVTAQEGKLTAYLEGRKLYGIFEEIAPPRGGSLGAPPGPEFRLAEEIAEKFPILHSERLVWETGWRDRVRDFLNSRAIRAGGEQESIMNRAWQLLSAGAGTDQDWDLPMPLRFKLGLAAEPFGIDRNVVLWPESEEDQTEGASLGKKDKMRASKKTVTSSPIPPLNLRTDPPRLLAEPSPPSRGRGEPPALRADRPGGGEGASLGDQSKQGTKFRKPKEDEGLPETVSRIEELPETGTVLIDRIHVNPEGQLKAPQEAGAPAVRVPSKYAGSKSLFAVYQDRKLMTVYEGPYVPGTPLEAYTLVWRRIEKVELPRKREEIGGFLDRHGLLGMFFLYSDRPEDLKRLLAIFFGETNLTLRDLERLIWGFRRLNLEEVAMLHGFQVKDLNFTDIFLKALLSRAALISRLSEKEREVIIKMFLRGFYKEAVQDPLHVVALLDSRITKVLEEMGITVADKEQKLLALLRARVAEEFTVAAAHRFAHIQTPLKPHEAIGAYRLRQHDRFALLDGTRVGKTIQALAALDLEDRTLIVSPAGVIDTWLEEERKSLSEDLEMEFVSADSRIRELKEGIERLKDADKFSVVVLRGDKGYRRKLLEAVEGRKRTILHVSYETLREMDEEELRLLEKVKDGEEEALDGIILDEWQYVEHYAPPAPVANRGQAPEVPVPYLSIPLFEKGKPVELALPEPLEEEIRARQEGGASLWAEIMTVIYVGGGFVRPSYSRGVTTIFAETLAPVLDLLEGRKPSAVAASDPVIRAANANINWILKHPFLKKRGVKTLPSKRVERNVAVLMDLEVLSQSTPEEISRFARSLQPGDFVLVFWNGQGKQAWNRKKPEALSRLIQLLSAKAVRVADIDSEIPSSREIRGRIPTRYQQGLFLMDRKRSVDDLRVSIEMDQFHMATEKFLEVGFSRHQAVALLRQIAEVPDAKKRFEIYRFLLGTQSYDAETDSWYVGENLVSFIQKLGAQEDLTELVEQAA